MVATPITEPVDKKTQTIFVQASQDLFWLFENGMGEVTAQFLISLRRETEAYDAGITKPVVTVSYPASGGKIVTGTTRLPEGILQVVDTYAGIVNDARETVGYSCTERRATLNGSLVIDPGEAQRLAAAAGWSVVIA